MARRTSSTTSRVVDPASVAIATSPNGTIDVDAYARAHATRISEKNAGNWDTLAPALEKLSGVLLAIQDRRDTLESDFALALLNSKKNEYLFQVANSPATTNFQEMHQGFYDTVYNPIVDGMSSGARAKFDIETKTIWDEAFNLDTEKQVAGQMMQYNNEMFGQMVENQAKEVAFGNTTMERGEENLRVVADRAGLRSDIVEASISKYKNNVDYSQAQIELQTSYKPFLDVQKAQEKHPNLTIGQITLLTSRARDMELKDRITQLQVENARRENQFKYAVDSAYDTPYPYSKTLKDLLMGDTNLSNPMVKEAFIAMRGTDWWEQNKSDPIAAMGWNGENRGSVISVMNSKIANQGGELAKDAHAENRATGFEIAKQVGVFFKPDGEEENMHTTLSVDDDSLDRIVETPWLFGAPTTLLDHLSDKYAGRWQGKSLTDNMFNKDKVILKIRQEREASAASNYFQGYVAWKTHEMNSKMMGDDEGMRIAQRNMVGVENRLNSIIRNVEVSSDSTTFMGLRYADPAEKVASMVFASEAERAFYANTRTAGKLISLVALNSNNPTQALLFLRQKLDTLGISASEKNPDEIRRLSKEIMPEGVTRMVAGGEIYNEFGEALVNDRIPNPAIMYYSNRIGR